MSRLFRGMAVLLGVTLLLAAGADAQTGGKPPQTSTVPPTVAKAPALETPAPVIALPRTPDPDLDLPDADTAKRVTGLGGEAVGGADCRTTCDKTYYVCLSNDDGGQCPSAWAQCLAACPAHSSNF